MSQESFLSQECVVTGFVTPTRNVFSFVLLVLSIVKVIIGECNGIKSLSCQEIGRSILCEGHLLRILRIK
jgi:hypothetical protein